MKSNKTKCRAPLRKGSKKPDQVFAALNAKREQARRLGRRLELEVPKCMRPFFAKTDPHGVLTRYRVVHGGRGSVKSWTIARALLCLGVLKKLFIVCGREYQKSIRDSVHRLLKNQIVLLGMQDEYDVKDTYIKNKRNGTEFVFYGLHHNIESLKSLEGADILWIEEAETLSLSSWEVLDPTIRKPGSEVWLSFNPKNETDPAYELFVKPPKGKVTLPGAVVVEVGWKDNPWLPEVLRAQAEWMRENDPEKYDYVWGGKTYFKNDAQVLNGKWCEKDFEVNPKWFGPYLGADWGFSQDPTCLVKSYVEVLNPDDIGKTTTNESGDEVPVPLHKNLYISEEVFAVGCDIINLPALFDEVSESRKYQIIADCARPETISHMVNTGGFLLMDGCEKWDGCVEDGVTYLRGFDRIYVHPACTHMLDEARWWSHKVDKLTKKVLRDLKPGYDHGWDAIRYAHQAMITREPSIFDALI